METLLAGLLAGLAATPHCLGMCGGFALHLARPDEGARGLWRQLAFFAGRAATYVFLGSLVGAFGLWALQAGPLANARHALVYVAGGLLLVLGFLMLGITTPLRLSVPAGLAGALLGDRLRTLLGARGALPAFLLGLGVGLLPCPLTAALMVAGAAGHSVTGGMLLLGGAALGTAPGLLGLGLAGTAVSARWRSIGTRALGVTVMLLGIAVILRGVGLLPGHGGCGR